MKGRLIAMVVCVGITGFSSNAFGQQESPPQRPVGGEASIAPPSGQVPHPTINLSGKDYFLLEKEKYGSFLAGMN